ncbi:MAG: 50S ribosomal protein L4 [bacterium JZ-2024 1]
MSIVVEIRDEEGKIAKHREVPDFLLGESFHPQLVNQAVRYYQWNRYPRSGHTKTRGEVSGGGRKPWRQKHTGRARHGSIRSPIWVGGGVVFGPKGPRRELKMNKRMRRKAFFSVLSQKWRDGELVFVTDWQFPQPSAREAKKKLEKLGLNEEKELLWVMVRDDYPLELSLRNLPKVRLVKLQRLNLMHLLRSDRVVIPESVLDKMLEVWGK